MYGCPVPAFPNVKYEAPRFNLAFCFSTSGAIDCSYYNKIIVIYFYNILYNIILDFSKTSKHIRSIV